MDICSRAASAAYRWLSRWFKGQEDDTPEEPVAPASEEELRCTDSGPGNGLVGRRDGILLESEKV